MPAGRVRHARAAPAARPISQRAGSTSSTSRRASASPFAVLAALRLRRHVHVRGRHADAPSAARRRSSLDRDLLRELLGAEELRDLLDRDAIERGRGRAARTGPDAPTSCTICCFAAATSHVRRVRPRRSADELVAERRAIWVRLGGGRAADRRRGRGALPRRRRCHASRRAARRVPRGRRGSARLPPRPLRARARALHDGGGCGALRPRAATRIEDALARARAGGPARPRRASPGGHRARMVRSRRPPPAAARDARPPAQGGRARRSRARSRRFLPAWQGVDRRASLREALVPLQGLALPVPLWESDVLPRRVPGYQPEQLDQLCASGEVVWVGAGLERVAPLYREDAPLLGRPGALPPPEGEAAERLRAALGARRVLLARPARRLGPRGRGRPACSLGARLGRRGHERRLAAAARGRRYATPRPRGRPRSGGASRAQRPDAITRRRVAGR